METLAERACRAYTEYWEEQDISNLDRDLQERIAEDLEAARRIVAEVDRRNLPMKVIREALGVQEFAYFFNYVTSIRCGNHPTINLSVPFQTLIKSIRRK